jgi:hypothetical protein
VVVEARKGVGNHPPAGTPRTRATCTHSMHSMSRERVAHSTRTAPHCVRATLRAGISAAAVKDLRTKTGAGMMDCKKALAENGGDMDKAIEVRLWPVEVSEQ